MADPYKDKTNEQIEGMIKAIKVITIAIAVVAGLVILLSIYTMLTKEDNSSSIPLIAVGASCFAMVPIQLLNIKKMKDELARRAESGN